MRHLLLLIVICFICYQSPAQIKLQLDISKACFYSGHPVDKDIYVFKSSDDAKNIVDKIVSVVGLKSNFEIQAANVPNACAMMQQGQRKIFYSETFIQRANLSSGTNWAAVSILAHEVGHHLNGHLLDNPAKRPTDELDADDFSGFVLAKLGATLDQALAAIQSVVDDSPDTQNNYPPKSARMEAVSVGWKRGKGSDGAAMPVPEKTPDKSAVTTGSIQVTNKINSTLTILIGKAPIEPGNFNIKYDEMTVATNATENFEALAPGKYYICAVFSRYDVSGCVFSKTINVTAGKKEATTISSIRTAFGAMNNNNVSPNHGVYPQSGVPAISPTRGVWRNN